MYKYNIQVDHFVDSMLLLKMISFHYFSLISPINKRLSKTNEKLSTFRPDQLSRECRFLDDCQ